MTNSTLSIQPSSRPAKALRASAIFWFLTALIGQWIFVYYIAMQYGGAALQGTPEAYNDMTLIGHADGDPMGNFMFVTHVLMAATITLGGTLQLIPQIRKRAIGFHRWNGRVFIVTAFLMALGGLYLVWIRDATTTLTGSIGITLNAALIMYFAARAITDARAGKIANHRRWALRTFIVVNGVWFFRVGLMGWIMINLGPRWVGENLDGPFASFWVFANYLLPLAILELYLKAERGTPAQKSAMTVLLTLSTLVMAIGIVGATLFMWAPNF